MAIQKRKADCLAGEAGEGKMKKISVIDEVKMVQKILLIGIIKGGAL